MSNWTQERRLDRAAEAEQDRKSQQQMFEAQLQAKQIEAEQKRLDKAEAAEQARKDAEMKRRQKREEQRQRVAKKEAAKLAAAAKRARLLRWLKANPATLFVAFVMVASIVPAIISQIGALSGARVNVALAALLAAMLEGGAWAVTFMGKQAEDTGRETRKYRIAGWSLAGMAGSVNLWHGLEQYKDHVWVAVVLGASSLFAFFIWDMKTHGSDGPTRAEKRDAKARAKHLAKRRSHHKDIAKEADRLMSALPFGSITEEDAFAAAWRIRNGAEPGLSAEVYAAATNSRVQLGAAFELGEHVRPELLRNGLMAAALNPLPNLLPTLGPVSPLPIPAAPSGTPGSQAGIGLHALPAASGKGAGEKRQDSSAGRSDEELAALFPEALKVAAELVAEGKQASTPGLAKRLNIRREDAQKLRDMVVAASDGTARKSITARIK